ncbi:MAG: SpoVG family protein [Hydrogenothermaceae bacterium]|nr:SpoVG family protein [Hydrogenothermaceae bacterium]
MKITEVRVYPFDTGKIGGRVRAVAEVIIDDILLIKDIKIVQSKTGGLFLSFPKKRSSSGKFVDIVQPLDKDFSESIRRAVVDKYKEMMQI